ncbi:HAD family hydrolase [Deinococcus fonticola]|uniref:HAD family hydrolase n=1 Tax=Deinococcus fonticola TaxID=2528713 RepID=UPI00107505C7|nr:HAD family phosphatase [Deinococcus fonticola]
MPTRTFAAVLFDLDGVLIDTESSITALWAEIFAGYDLHFTRQEITRLTAGQRFSGVLQQLEEQRGWKAPEDFLPMLDERFNRAFEEVPVIEGAAETLAALKRTGLPFAVASNSQHNRLFMKLEGAGLLPAFQGRAYDPSLTNKIGKPAPDLYLYAARQLNVSIHDCLVIEDSAPGATAGVAAGATTWGFLAGSHIHTGDEKRLRDIGVSHIVHSHAQLREALGLS